MNIPFKTRELCEILRSRTNKDFKSCRKEYQTLKEININKSRTKLINQMLISYALVIIVCMSFMGLLLYFYLTKGIEDQAENLNSKLVAQFCDSVDKLIFKNVSDYSLRIMQEIQENTDIEYFFESSLDDKLIEAAEIRKQLEDMKASNMMLSNLGILFGNTNAIISSKYVNNGDYLSGGRGNEEALQFKKNSEAYDRKYYWVANVYDNITSNNAIKKTADISLVRKIPYNMDMMGNEKNSAVIFTIDEGVFYDIIRKSSTDELDNIIIIINNDGTIIVSSDRETIGQNINMFEYGNKIFESEKLFGNISFKNNKTKFVVSYCTSRYTEWKYISITPIKNYFKAYDFIIRTVLFASALACVLGIIISVLFANRISNPIRKLATFCNEMYSNLDKKLLNKKMNEKANNECIIIHSTINALNRKINEQDERFKKTLPVLKTNFINNLISNQITDTNEIKNKIMLYDIDFPFNRFIVIVMKIHNPDIEDYNVKFEYNKFDFITNIENKLNTKFSRCMSCEKDRDYTFMVNFEMSEKEILKHIMDVFYYEFSQNFDINVGVGTIVNNIQEVYRSYDASITGIKYSYIFPKRMFFSLNDVIDREKNIEGYNIKLVKSFTEAMNTFNSKKISIELKKIINYVLKSDISYNSTMELLYECVSIAENTMNRIDMSLINLAISEEDIKTQFKKIDNIYEFEIWFRDLLKSIIEFNEQNQSEKNKLLVEAAKRYIRKNIKDSQLSLKTVAEELFVSESYLSRVFKKEVNKNFIGYVIDVKLECVKDYLLSDNRTIAEIAEEMGYSSPQYLTKRFIKKYGCTPSDYRQKYAVKKIINN